MKSSCDGAFSKHLSCRGKIKTFGLLYKVLRGLQDIRSRWKKWAVLLHEPRPCSGCSQRRDPTSPCRVTDAGGQGSRHTRLSIPCCGNQPHVTGETETGKVLQGMTTDCMQNPELQEDQRSGMDEKCFEHRKIRGQKPSLWLL